MNARIFAIALAFSLTTGALHAQMTLPISVVVEHFPDVAPNSYNLFVSGFFVDGSFAVAPDGTTLSSGNNVFNGLTAADVTSRFAGLWTWNDRFGLPAADPPQQHQFTVTASQMLNGFLASAPIVSPPAGSIVPRTFEVQLPSSTNGGLHLFGLNGATTMFKNLGSGRVELTINFPPGVDEIDLDIRSTRDSDTELPFATPLSPNPLHRFDPRVVRRALSVETILTVRNVPEPSAYVLAGAATLAVGRVSRWRRLRSGPAA